MLKFYIISTILSFVVAKISMKAIAAQLKREGYKSKVKYSLWEKMHLTLPILIPLLNIFLALFCVFNKESIMEKTKLRLNSESESL